MRTTLILVFLFGIQHLLFAQNEFIELKAEPANFQAKGFYIQKVEDGRINRDNIGFVQKGAFNRKVTADLRNGVESAIFNYLKTSVSQDTAATPIIMRIVHLNISERTNAFSEYGRAEIAVEFYKNENGNQGKVYEAEAFIDKPAMDVTKGHEKRIREVLLMCLEKFNNSGWENAVPVQNQELPVVENVVAANTLPKQEPVVSSYGMQQAPRWNSLLTFNKTLGVNADGWALTYYGYTNSEKSKWIIPWVISIENYTVDPTYFSQWGYSQAQFSYYMPGISAFNKLNEKGNLMANFTFMIPVGSEKLTDYSGRESTHFVIGLAPTQGIYFVPESNFGITFGIGVYEKLMTSKVYKSDIGIKFEFGLKF